MNLTPNQATAIAHRGSNLLVAASAGAGKTEVLARRCVSLIADPQRPCGIDRLLVVTFTRAAAAELRVRIARMLRDEADRSRSGEVRRHLRRQEMLVEAADIGTIDAWCGRIVREHFAEAGVDVRFSVLAEQDAKVLRADVLDSLLDQIHRGGDALIDEARAWLARGITPDDRFLRELIARLNAFREHLINPDQWFERQRAICTSPDAERVLAAALTEECGFQHEQLGRWIETLPSEASAVLRPYSEALADWRTRLGSPGTIAEVAAAIAEFDLPKPSRRKNAPPEPPEITEVRQRWLVQRLQKHWSPDDVTAILAHEPATGALVATLLRLEERYRQMLTAAKWGHATYEFADVLRLALDLLGSPAAGREREPTEIARRLQQRYEHILVDEYQDTSPVQVEILRLVTRVGAGRTNRFMVGDVKQSIYGFRQAEPRLFAELSAAFEAGRAEGRVEYLADNFRSHARVLAALNRLFERLFDPALGGTPYGEKERLRAGRAEGEIDNPTLPDDRVEIHVVEHDPWRKAAEPEEADEVEAEVIEREAQLAAEQIRAMLGAGVQVPERGADGAVQLRPLRLGDIVILLRSAVRKAGQVASVLRRNGVHCVAAGREALLDAVEVIDVCNVLKLLVNRRQDVPLAGYLRSPLAGLSAAELLQVRTALDDRNADFYDAVDHFRRTRPVASLAAKLDAALAQLDHWALAAQEEELPALLRRIFQDSGILLLARALKGGEQRVALLRSLQSFAATFAEAGQGALDEFIDYLEALAKEEIDPGALAAGDEDAVRIMTIHGAKGLEFPVVFLLGGGTQFNVRRQQESLQCDEELGLGLKFSDYPARATMVSARQHINQRRVARRETDEELRLLYVATTRARERLIIVGHAKPGTWDDYRARHSGRPDPPPLVSRMSVHSHLEWVMMAAAADGTLLPVTTHPAAEIHVPEPGATGVAESPPPPAEPTPEDEAWLSRAGELLAADIGSTTADLPAMLSVSAVKELALRERTEDRPHVLDAVGLVLSTPDFAVAGAAPDGRELGTACHRFLEHADLGRLGASAEVQAQVDACIVAGQLSAEQAALVPVADLAWLGTTELGALFAHFAAAARREVPFVFALSLAGSGEQTIVRGVIDCLLDTPTGLVLVDYKTDHVRDERDLEERLAGYRVQLQLYALAAGAIFERPVARAVLAFVRARQIVNVPLDVPALAALFDLPSVT